MKELLREANSARVTEPGAERGPCKHEHRKTRSRGRAEPVGWHPTTEWTSAPMTPVWARLPVSAVSLGSMGCLGRDPRIMPCGSGEPDRLIGTARCGPASRVVWDPLRQMVKRLGEDRRRQVSCVQSRP